MISFSVPLAPVAWQRVKVNRYGASYVPNKTRNFKEWFGTFASQYRSHAINEGPIELSLTFFVPSPKRCSRTWPCVRPDLDNYIKAVKDALNGVLYKDDGQIVILHARKEYGPSGSIQVEMRNL
jgi:Holliday junction resolvase RusA-like endonuclease